MPPKRIADRCKKCRKTALLDERHAIHAALHDSAKFGKPYTYYPCRHGNGWHLTTRPAREVRDAP
jgi:hypothetical protein